MYSQKSASFLGKCTLVALATPEPIVLVIFNIKSARYLVLFAGKSSAGWRNCQVLIILTKARAFLSTTTQSSCFKGTVS